MLRIAAVSVFFLAVACSDNPITSDSTDIPQARPTINQQNPQIALLQLEQGFNDLNRWIVSGRIKNISSASVSDISIKTTLYQDDGTLIFALDERPEHGGYSDLPPQGETTFSITFYQYLHLDQKTPDRSRTVVDILIDGYKVSFDNRAELAYHDQFDFRFSNWGDDEETVASNEPGGFWLSHIAGGKSTKESFGYATAVLEFSETVQDSVNVVYGFRAGILWFGAYDFAQSVPTSKMDTIKPELTERYGTGTTVEGLEGVTGWTIGSRTFVFLYPANEERGIRIGYVSANAQLDTDTEDEYNRLPLRVVVPEL